jgi:hypothetical protein
MKICTKCNIEKPLTDFYKMKRGKYGVSSICKLCTNAHYKEYYEANKDKAKAYREANKDKIKEYREANKDKLKEWGEKYRKTNKDKIREWKKEYYEANKDKVKDCVKEYREANKDKIKAYKEANKDKAKEYRKAYTKQRKKEDPLFKLRCNTSSLIYYSIKNKGYTKKSKTYQILGCTYEEFKIHLERQFTKGMTWENQGEWHLDHIYPVSLAKDEEELIKLNHYTNFQPLWAEDNLKKSNKIDNGKQIKLL